MPTIDQLGPATAASDTDEFPASQNGTTRKVSRRQIIAGLQAQIALGSGTVMGRASQGTGAPEQIAVGANLSLVNGTLSATATPYVVAGLPAGTVPGPGDLVALGQGGTNTAVPFAQFAAGIAGVPGIDGSGIQVTPTGGTAPVRLADVAAGALPRAGGAVTGPLTLAADPAQPLQAATKQYVDAQSATALPRAGGAVTGPLTLAADPAQPLQAATRQYVDAQTATALPRAGGAVTGPLTLAADPAQPMQAATKQYVDAQAAAALPRAGGAVTGPLMLAGDPAQALQAATKQYVDSTTATALPRAGGQVSGAITLPADPAQPLQAATKQYVDARLKRSGDSMTGQLVVGGPDQSYGALTINPVQRYAPVTSSADQTTSYLLSAASAGSGVLSNLARTTDVFGAPNFGVWSGLDRLDFSGSGGTGQHVANYVQAIRTTYAAGGAANNPQIWAATLESRDATGQPSATTNAQLCVEMDLFANGADNANGGQGQRQIQSLVAAKHDPNGANCEVGTGTGYYAGGGDSFKQVIYVGAPFSVAALNTKGATELPGAHTIWLGTGQTIALDTAGNAGAANVTLASDGASALVAGGLKATGPLFVNGPTARFGSVTVTPWDFFNYGPGKPQIESYLLTKEDGDAPAGAYGVVQNMSLETSVNSAANYYVRGLVSSLNYVGPDAGAGSGGTGEHVAGFFQTIRSTAFPGGGGGNPQIRGVAVESRDASGQPSAATNGQQTLELSLFANGADTGGDGQRTGHSLSIDRHDPNGADVEVGIGAGYYSTAHAAFRRVIQVAGRFGQAAFDTRDATPLAGANTLWLGAGQTIALDAAGAGGAAVVALSSDGHAAQVSGALQVTGAGTAASVVRAAGSCTAAAFDASAATAAAGTPPGLLLRQDQPIAFTADAKWLLAYDSTSGRAVLSFNGTRLFSIDAAGNVRAAGTVTGNVAP